ncbi:unnamed protein product, partial [Urochloa humidicola]
LAAVPARPSLPDGVAPPSMQREERRSTRAEVKADDARRSRPAARCGTRPGGAARSSARRRAELRPSSAAWSLGRRRAELRASGVELGPTARGAPAGGAQTRSRLLHGRRPRGARAHASSLAESAWGHALASCIALPSPGQVWQAAGGEWQVDRNGKRVGESVGDVFSSVIAKNRDGKSDSTFVGVALTSPVHLNCHFLSPLRLALHRRWIPVGGSGPLPRAPARRSQLALLLIAACFTSDRSLPDDGPGGRGARLLSFTQAPSTNQIWRASSSRADHAR